MVNLRSIKEEKSSRRRWLSQFKAALRAMEKRANSKSAKNESVEFNVLSASYRTDKEMGVVMAAGVPVTGSTAPAPLHSKTFTDPASVVDAEGAAVVVGAGDTVGDAFGLTVGDAVGLFAGDGETVGKGSVVGPDGDDGPSLSLPTESSPSSLKLRKVPLEGAELYDMDMDMDMENDISKYLSNSRNLWISQSINTQVSRVCTSDKGKERFIIRKNTYAIFLSTKAFSSHS